MRDELSPNIIYTFIVLMIIISVGVSYSQVLHGKFLDWDDLSYVLNNKHIQHINIKNLWWMLSSFSHSNWHPLTWFSHSLDYAVWGDNPFGHHLSNLILHIANCFILFLVCNSLLRMTSGENYEINIFGSGKVWLISFSVTLMFAVHPLHVESVAWIAERKDVLYSFFYLLSVFMYLTYIETENKKYKYYTIITFFMSVMSKSMAISLPIVLLIIDFYPGMRFPGETFRNRIMILVRDKLTLFIIMFAVITITLITQSSGGAVRSFEKFPLFLRLENAANSFLVYPLELLFPFNLSPFYPVPDYITKSKLVGLLPILLCIGIFIFCMYLALKRNIKAPLVVLLLYAVMVLPVIGIVQVGNQGHADRYTYLSTLPIMLAIIVAIYRFLNRVKVNPVVTTIILFVPTIVMGFETYTQTRYWQSDRNLWGRVVEVFPNKVAFAYTNLGNTYYSAGNLKIAEHYYIVSRKIKPNNYDSLYNLLLIYEKTDRVTLARDKWKRLVKLNPNDPTIWLDYGDFNLRQHDQASAIKAYKMAAKTGGSSQEILQALQKRGFIIKK